MLLGLLLFQFLGTGVLLLLVNLLKSKLFLKMFFLLLYIIVMGILVDCFCVLWEL